MRVAVVQTDPIFGDVESNIANAVSLMETVNADLYVLPELFNTGYNFINQEEVLRFAETTSEITIQSLLFFAGKKSCYVVAGFAEKAGKIYNSSALVGPNGLVGIYRKVHLYFREKLFFSPGNLGFPVFDLPIGKIGMMICFDWIYPEAARTLALNGAQLIAHPSNLVLPYCPEAMVTRCLENRVFTATANRVGNEERGNLNLKFIGRSEVVSPGGEIMSRLGVGEAGITVVDLNMNEANNKQVNEYNNLFEDRKPKAYLL